MFVVKCPLLSVGTELCENLSFSAGVLVLVPFIIPFYHDLSRYVSIHVYHRRICGLYIYIYIYIYTHTKITQNSSLFLRSHMVPTKLYQNLTRLY